MADLSVSRAAFSGFSVTARKPWLVIAWAAIWLGSMILMGIVFTLVVMVTGVSGAFASMTLDPEAGAAALVPFIGMLIVAYLLMLLVMLFVRSMMTVAVFRSVLWPDQVGFAYVKVGGAEFRQLLVYVVHFLLFIGIYLGLGAVTLLLTLILKTAGSVLGGLLIVAGLIYFAVRLSLSGPQTLSEGRINIFGSWALTKGKFWSTFASFLIPWLICVGIIIAIVAVVFMLFAMTAGTAGLAALGNPEGDPTAALAALSGMFIVLALLYFVGGPLLAAYLTAVMTAPAASVYQQLAEKGQEAVF